MSCRALDEQPSKARRQTDVWAEDCTGEGSCFARKFDENLIICRRRPSMMVSFAPQHTLDAVPCALWVRAAASSSRSHNDRGGFLSFDGLHQIEQQQAASIMGNTLSARREHVVNTVVTLGRGRAGGRYQRRLSG